MSGQTRLLAELRERVRRIERPATTAHGVAPFGVAAIDRALPGGGLARGALHEIVGAGGDEEDGALAVAFAALIVGRLGSPTSPSHPSLSPLQGGEGNKARQLSLSALGGGEGRGESLPRTRSGVGAIGAMRDGIVLWCLPRPDIYGPGLAVLGLDPARLVLVRAAPAADILWAMEEGLRTAGVAAVIGETGALPAVASRRLQLAAERSGVTAFVLRRWRNGAEAARERNLPTAAATRWRISALPSAPIRIDASFPLLPQRGRGFLYEPGIGHPRWRVELLRCRGGAPGCWEVEIGQGEIVDAADALSVAAPLADRPAAADGRGALPPERYRLTG